MNLLSTTFEQNLNRTQNFSQEYLSIFGEHFSEGLNLTDPATLNKYTIREENPDFTEYQDKENDIWSGFYCTRPNFKLKIRRYFRTLSKVRNLISYVYLRRSNEEFYSSYNFIENFLESSGILTGILLHHDAITATSNAHVIDDYEKMIERSVDSVNAIMHSTTEDLISKSLFHTPEKRFKVNGVCKTTGYFFDCEAIINSGDTLMLTIFGNIRNSKHFIMIRVNSPLVTPYDMEDNPISYTLYCTQLRPREDCFLSLEVEVPPSGFVILKLVIKDFNFDDYLYQTQLSLKNFNNQRILKKAEESKEQRKARKDLSIKAGIKALEKAQYRVISPQNDKRNENITLNLGVSNYNLTIAKEDIKNGRIVLKFKNNKRSFTLTVSLKKYHTMGSGLYLFKPNFQCYREPLEVDEQLIQIRVFD